MAKPKAGSIHDRRCISSDDLRTVLRCVPRGHAGLVDLVSREPPRSVTWLTQIMVWPPTVTIFAVAALTGLLEWNALDWPMWFRFGVGLSLILAGNIVVWRAAFGIGMDATSGARSELKTDGFYRWSRNPQYVADMAILIRWAVLSASSSA